MDKENVVVEFILDTDTREYIKQDADKHKVNWRRHIADILKNEKEKAKRRPKVTIEKE